MGSIGSGPRLATFQNDIFATGLDLGQYDIQRAGGFWKASAAATFEQGMLVMLDSAGEVVIADGGTAGARLLGVAKWNRTTAGLSVIVDEPVVVSFGGVSTLKKPNVSLLVVRDTANMSAGAAGEIPALNNYTLNATNGTITWTNPPTGTNAPANGDTVYVTYHFAMTIADYNLQGRNFFNFIDDTGVANDRITVIQPPAIIHTSKFVSSLTFAINEAVYMGGVSAGQEGYITNSNASSPPLIGYVVQLPSAGYPFLGVNLISE